MDVFLFHIALDEILPVALIVLALLWLVLARGYLQFRVVGPLAASQRAELWLLLGGSAIVLAVLTASGLVVERTTPTPLVRVGQQASDFALDSTDGGTVSLSAARGQPVALALVPSVLCDFCRQQLGGAPGGLA
jgi:hypothetical protein